mgnify:FL=1
MVLAHTRAEEEAFDMQMIMLSWQTSLLLNGTGNFKKKIKPTDLYTPLDKQKEQEKIKAEGIDPEEKRKLQDELKATFGLS